MKGVSNILSIFVCFLLFCQQVWSDCSSDFVLQTPNGTVVLRVDAATQTLTIRGASIQQSIQIGNQVLDQTTLTNLVGVFAPPCTGALNTLQWNAGTSTWQCVNPLPTCTSGQYLTQSSGTWSCANIPLCLGGQTLQYDGANFFCRSLPVCIGNSVLSFRNLTSGPTCECAAGWGPLYPLCTMRQVERNFVVAFDNLYFNNQGYETCANSFSRFYVGEYADLNASPSVLVNSTCPLPRNTAASIQVIDGLMLTGFDGINFNNNKWMYRDTMGVIFAADLWDSVVVEPLAGYYVTSFQCNPFGTTNRLCTSGAAWKQTGSTCETIPGKSVSNVTLGPNSVICYYCDSCN